LIAGLYKLWETVVYAPTLEDFNIAWEKLKAYFYQQTAIILYFEDNWMPLAKEWATCYCNKRLNFG